MERLYAYNTRVPETFRSRLSLYRKILEERFWQGDDDNLEELNIFPAVASSSMGIALLWNKDEVTDKKNYSDILFLQYGWNKHIFQQSTVQSYYEQLIDTDKETQC